MVRYPERERRSLGDLEDMRIRAADGTEMPFAAVADFTLGRGYSDITRVDRQRVVTVRADEDRDIVSAEAVGWSILTASILGLIALAGVVVNSSQVLVDYADRQRRMRADAYTAAYRSAVVRFRPIVITSATTFAGLMPLMLNTNPATVFVVPMAISLAWGVVFATVITLFLVPCCYLILEDFLPSGALVQNLY